MSAVRHHPDPEQRDLADEFDRPLDSLLPLARLHAQATEPIETWAGLAEMGLFGIALPEDVGGVGLGAVEEALVAEKLGRRLAAPCVFATMSAAHGAPSVAFSSAVAEGGARVAPAWVTSHGVTVADGDQADHVLLRDASSIALYRITGFGALEPLDDVLWLTSLARSADAGEAIATFDTAARLRARLIDAAALSGMAGAALDMAVAYAGLREQFGRPIGSFQAIKHFCADMAMAARAATDQTAFAAVAIDDGRSDAGLQVECAVLLSIQAALSNARINIQIHGGIGFSDEANPHLLLKRAHLQATIAGGVEAASLRTGAAERAL